MKRKFIIFGALVAFTLGAWWAYDYALDWRYAHQPFEVERVDAPTFTVEIPKGWNRPNYADPRESKNMFQTSTNSKDEGDPYFVLSTLSVEDYGESATVESVMAGWRKDGERQGRVSRVRLGDIETETWTTALPFVDISGKARTFVFRGTNGHIYSGFYMLSGGGFRMRQDYVFGRILASMKFRDAPQSRGAAAATH
jgi:hypothetical protein